MTEQTLQGPVFVVDPTTKVVQLFNEQDEAVRAAHSFFEELETLDSVFKDQPNSASNTDVVTVMSTAIGIRVGSDAETKYDTQLIKAEKNGTRKLKQDSKLLKQIKALPSYRKAENAVNLVRDFRFELGTYFGPNNTDAFHWLDDVFYVSLRSPSICPVIGETVFEADYVSYLDSYIAIEKENKKQIGGN